MTTTIFYNPRCSKCRQALALLRGKGVEPTILRYLEEPPGRQVLERVLRKLGLAPQEIIRFDEPAARGLGLTPGDQRSRSAWIGLLVEHPELLQRPIVVRGDRAVLGRPPEKVLGLFEGTETMPEAKA